MRDRIKRSSSDLVYFLISGKKFVEPARKAPIRRSASTASYPCKSIEKVLINSHLSQQWTIEFGISQFQATTIRTIFYATCLVCFNSNMQINPKRTQKKNSCIVKYYTVIITLKMWTMLPLSKIFFMHMLLTFTFGNSHTVPILEKRVVSLTLQFGFWSKT